MTNERRHDKDSSTGSHQKRMGPRGKMPLWGTADVNTPVGQVAKAERFGKMITLLIDFV